jgi:hypothetical protein
MKKVVLLIILFNLSSGGYTQNPNSICCRGLAPSNPGSIRLPMVSKAPLDVRQECPDGTALRAISFSHKTGEILTYQESFGLTCASSLSVVTNQCSWGQLISNFDTHTWALALADSIVTGVRFTHRNGEDFTYQQSFAIRTCRLQDPRPRDFSLRGKPRAGTTKWHLESHASCEVVLDGVRSGLVDSLGFSHASGLNGTHQESVHLGCVWD